MEIAHIFQIFNVCMDSILNASASRTLLRRKWILKRKVIRKKKLLLASLMARHAILLSLAPLGATQRLTVNRNGTFWESDCQVNDDTFFKNNFRMERSSFIYLCEMLQALGKQDTRFRRCIPLEKRIAIALYALGSSSEYRSIGNLFGIGKSTVCEILIDFCKEVWSSLKHIYFQSLPLTADKLAEYVSGFQTLGLPQCLGALDGCHIEVHPRAQDATDFYNYKGWYSTILLALVDYRYRFMYIDVGSPGRCNDSQVYQSSSLKRYLDECPLLEQHAKNISGIQVPVYIIGDSAFRFSRKIMKPYPYSPEQPDDQKHFNYVLSKSRRVVENAFGHLKARFRRIGKGIDNNIINATTVIKACCILHNFLNERNDVINQKWIAVQENIDRMRGNLDENTTIGDSDSQALEIRRAITSFLGNTFIHNST